MNPPLPRLPLPDRVPLPESEALDRFLAWVGERGLTLYPAQEEAILALAEGKNVILATPTGSGKSLVAAFLHYLSLCRGERSFYTSPIKALANEKFFELCRDFGPNEVSLVTGDGRVNEDAPITCATAEILSNLALREGARAPVDHACLDEFHYYSDKDRGLAWQVPLLTLPRTRFLLMSATLGDTLFFERALTALNGRETAVVRSRERPVPLEFEYSEVALGEAISSLVKRGRAPVYVVCFTQRSAAEEAQNLMSVDFLSKEAKRAIAEALRGERFDTPFGKVIERHVRHGIGVHHAGMLPRYRLVVEKLAQRGMLQVICGTDTLGVGVNIPIRTVLFTKLCKYDGEKTALLAVRDFHQIAGRAGRKGFDDRGYVVAQAPEHVIENLRLEAKAGDDPVKKKRIVRKRPPDHGYVHWDRAAYDKLIASSPESLVSRFTITHGTVLQVLSREHEDGCRALYRLVRDCHESPKGKKLVATRGRQLVRSLLEARLIEPGRTPEGGRRVHVEASLQANFSMHQALSLYLVDAIEHIPDDAENYSLLVLSLAESILENPEIVLQKQLDKKKQAKLAELKAAGVEYEERMAELEKVELDKPEAEFIYETFNAFREVHPWVGENIRPKGVARAMFEGHMGFVDYVKELGLERSEGTLLRYLSDVVKVLAQTVPAPAKTDTLLELEAWLRAIVTEVDASLLEEWERLRDPSRAMAIAKGETPTEPEELDVTRDRRTFRVMIRNRAFALVRALAAGAWEEAAAQLGDAEWPVRALEDKAAAFVADEGPIATDPEARSPKNTVIWEDGERAPAGTWTVEQLLSGAEGVTPWALTFSVDLDQSRAEKRPAMRLVGFGVP